MFKVYGTCSCAWCDRAKELLKSKDRQVEYVNVETDTEAQQMFREQRLRTVPQVYHNGKHIGGYEALADYLLEIS